MGKFGRSARRLDRKRDPIPAGRKSAIPRKYHSSGTFTSITEKGEDGKFRLTREGKYKMAEKLRQIDYKRELAARSLERRRRHDLLKIIFSKPINFKTSDGKKIRILSHGFENVYRERNEAKPRAFLIAFVNGKQLFFYRSSGEVSKLPGEWFPTYGPNVQDWKEPYTLGRLAKIQGHPDGYLPNPKPHFAPWMDEVRRKIKSSESKLTLHPDWGIDKYLEIKQALQAIPLTGEVKAAD